MPATAPLFPPESAWRPTPVSELPVWPRRGRVGYDVETRDPDLKTLGAGVRRPATSGLVGVSFSIEDGPRHYLPFGHAGGDNLDRDQVLAYLRDQSDQFEGDIVGGNLQYDLDWSAEHGIVFPRAAAFRDIMVADPLINELHRSYSVDSIAKRWGFDGKDEAVLREAAVQYGVHAKHGLWELPARYVGQYAEMDADLPLRVLRRQERKIEEDELEKVYDLETRLLPVLVRMKRRGVRVNLNRLEKIERWTVQEEAIALAEVQRLTGVKIGNGVWQAEAIAPALRAIGVEPPKTEKGAPSITAAMLDGLHHPVADAIKRARKVNKLRTTFAASVRDYQVNGRIHAQFNQLRRSDDGDDDDGEGARFGRMSSADPNLQQQPSRDEFARMWRSIYLPEEGEEWCSNDYSKQEPMWIISLAERLGLRGAKQVADLYRTDPTVDIYNVVNSFLGVGRTPSKIIFLGRSYNMQGKKLAIDLGKPTRMMVYGPRGTSYPVDSEVGRQLVGQGNKRFVGPCEEVEEYLRKIDAEMPFVRELSRRCEQRAKEVGYVKTASGRRCHFEQDENGNFVFTYRALNRVIQGSAGDQAKQALVNIDKEGYRILFPVHDEIAASIRSRADGEAIAELMKNAWRIEMPMRVDTEIGPSWGESMSGKTPYVWNLN